MTDDDFVPKDFLPEYYRHCGFCAGKGEYEQTYTAGCGGGYFRSTGPCDHCKPKDSSTWKGTGIVHKSTGEPAPKSVLIQIENAMMTERENRDD